MTQIADRAPSQGRPVERAGLDPGHHQRHRQ